MANRYVDELRLLTSRLVLTEAQQRRALFETQLAQTRDQLTKAQQALQASGFSQEALKADAKASAEGYARLRAEVTAAEVRLQALRRGLADTTPEVQQALSTAGALRAQLSKLAESADLSGAPDYVSKFREFKYQEALFELLARQYELARVDESREGALVQVVDEAKPAEHKHRPLRALIAAARHAGLADLAGCLLDEPPRVAECRATTRDGDEDRRACGRPGGAASRTSRGHTMTMIVTGGAGFIGSNFVLDWLAHGDESRGQPRRADLRRQPAQPRLAARQCAACLRAGRHLRPRADGQAVRRAPAARRGALRGREPRRPQHPRPRRVHAHQRAGHVHAARSARAHWTALARRRQERLPLPARLHRRGLRLALAHRAGLHRDARRTNRTAPIRRARPPATTWCAPGITPTACRC